MFWQNESFSYYIIIVLLFHYLTLSKTIKKLELFYQNSPDFLKRNKNTQKSLYLWGAILVGVDIPRLVVRRELEVILSHELVATPPTLRGDPGDDVPVPEVYPEVLLVVWDARRPRTAAWWTTGNYYQLGYT